jgi:hypothetical protein
LPGNANTRLLSKWKELSAAGVPILVFKAPGIKAQGSKPRMGEFDYLEFVSKLVGRKTDLVVKSIENADHSFANRKGREAVREGAEGWLANHFPLTNSEFYGNASSLPGTGNKRSDTTISRVAPTNPDCALEGR